MSGSVTRGASDIAFVLDVLTGAGMSAQAGPLVGATCDKLAMNVLGSVLPAVLGRSGLPPSPALFRAADSLAEELVALFAGVEGAVAEPPATWRTSLLARVVGVISTPERPSLLQDLEAGRPTERAMLVDALVALGRVTGVPTPRLSALGRTVRRAERAGPLGLADLQERAARALEGAHGDLPRAARVLASHRPPQGS